LAASWSGSGPGSAAAAPRVTAYAASRAAAGTREVASNQTDAVSDLRYYLTALPKDASQSEKRKLLEELANSIRNIDTSDVFVISIWIGE
jgi:hypothetical protein